MTVVIVITGSVDAAAVVSADSTEIAAAVVTGAVSVTLPVSGKKPESDACVTVHPPKIMRDAAAGNTGIFKAIRSFFFVYQLL